MKNSRSAAMKTSSCGGASVMAPSCLSRVESRARDDNRAMRRGELTKRWSPARAGIVVALCLFAALGWQGVTTVGQIGGDDAGEHLAYAQYLDAHHRIPGKAVNYEYSTPPLFQITAVAAERDRPPPAVGQRSSCPGTRRRAGSGCCSSRAARSR